MAAPPPLRMSPDIPVGGDDLGRVSHGGRDEIRGRKEIGGGRGTTFIDVRER